MARLVVIDDDDQLRGLLVRVLERAGHVVHEADNGRTGFQLALQVDPDVVITDIVMPEQEGIETIMALRSERPGLPIIAMSGGAAFGSEEYLKIAEKLGAIETLNKPFLPQTLVEAVESAVAAVH